MDEARLGSIVRWLRVRHGWRQLDLARRAGISPDLVRRIEHGRLGSVPLGKLERVVISLGGQARLSVWWRGGDLERGLNERHAALHEAVARWLRNWPAWTVVPEVSFSVYGERGVIDIVAWHAASRTLLVIELKTELVDISGLLGQVDRYRRLAPRAVLDRGWRPKRVAVWVVVAPGRSNARRLAGHATVLRAALPDDGRAIRGWLERPDRPLACLSFLPERELVPVRQAVAASRRVRATRPG